MNVAAGDTIRLTYHDQTGRTEQIDHPIEKAATYDTMAIGEINDELGFKEGLVGVIGNSDDA